MTTLEDIVMDVIHAYMDIIKIQTASVSKMYVCAVMEILNVEQHVQSMVKRDAHLQRRVSFQKPA